MDVSFVIRQRLEEFGLDQRELARAADVTESYISQLLTRKKAPPAPEPHRHLREDGQVPEAADAGSWRGWRTVQRKEELKRELGEEPRRLFRGQSAQLILRKCHPDQRRRTSARSSSSSPSASSSGWSPRRCSTWSREWPPRNWRTTTGSAWWRTSAAEAIEEMRVIVLEFLDTDIFHLSPENCVSFLDPLIESWDIDLATFALEIVLNPRVVAGHVKRFEFVEREAAEVFAEEPGLREFLDDPALSGTATEEEIEFLRRLNVTGRRPTSAVLLPGAAEPQRPAPFSHGRRSP